MRLDAYYYGFEPTGVEAIDRILSAVACAGKAYHYTQMWTEKTPAYEPFFRGASPVEWIQNAAADAAAELGSGRTLADATNDPADLSSLRKGAEVAVKPLRWIEPARLNNGCWTAESIFGTFSVGFDDGWHACIEDGVQWEWEPENDPRSYEGPFAAQEACQLYLETRIRSALVSGSRED